MTLGSKLKEKRLELNLTQIEVAKKLFVSPQTISRWELDQSLPSIFFILEISSIYNVSLDYLLKEDESVKKAYKNKDKFLKLVAIILAILYLILFSYLILSNLNKEVKSVPIKEINAVNFPKKISSKDTLTIQFNKRNIEGFDSQYVHGNLYIVVLYKPISWFNSIDKIDIPLEELLKVNNVSSTEDIKSIIVVNYKKNMYNKNTPLEFLSEKKEIYKRE